MIAHIKSDGTKQSLEEHLLNTAKIARTIGKKVSLSNLMYLTALFHDLGKATDRFTEYLMNAFVDPTSVRRGEVNHSSAGGRYIYEQFYNGDKLRILTSQFIVYAILAHHGLLDVITVEGEFKFDQRLYPKREIYYDEVIMKTKDFLTSFDISIIFDHAVSEVKDLLDKINNIMKEMECDKKDGVENYYFLLGCIQRLILSLLIDADYRETANFMDNIELNINDEKHQLWKELEKVVNEKVSKLNSNTPINILRSQLSNESWRFGEQPPGIYCLHIPTGGGKTISGLRYALNHAKKYNKDRIIYVAPYLSILEQNADEYRKFLENEDLILEHHSNIVIEDDEQIKEYKLYSQNWDKPVILTTMVQFLNTLFSGKMQSIRRMHQLANAVIIIDEIQSLPIKTIHMFNLMMTFLSKVCQTTIILSSATQPLLGKVKRKIIYSTPKDMIQSPQKYYKAFKRTTIIPLEEKMNTEELVSFILEKSKVEESMLVIINTKQAVRNVYEELKNRQALEEDTYLIQLTTFMCPQHRSDVINDLKQQLGNRKVLCISTQLIEAGVDISFSCVIRSSAGLDRIAQAAGRCNRNGEKEDKGKVYVVQFMDENLSRLKEIRDEQYATNRLLDIYKRNPQVLDYDLLSDKAMDAYYQNYYFNKVNEMDYNLSNQSSEHTLFSLLSINHKGVKAYLDLNNRKPPYTHFCQAFKTAGEAFEVIDSNTIGLIVPYKQGKNLIETITKSEDTNEIKKALQKAQRYTVNIHPHSQMIKELIQRRAIYPALNDTVLILYDEFYDESFGITSELFVDII